MSLEIVGRGVKTISYARGEGGSLSYEMGQSGPISW